MKEIKPIQNFEEFIPNDELKLYNPNLIFNYDTRDVIANCVHYRKLTKRKELSDLYCNLERMINSYSLSLDFILESAEEHEEIYRDSVFPQFAGNRKKEFIKDYNESIEELKEQHDFIELLTIQIEEVPLRGKWLFPFA